MTSRPALDVIQNQPSGFLHSLGETPLNRADDLVFIGGQVEGAAGRLTVRNNRHLKENMRLVELGLGADAGARPEDHPLMFDRALVLQGAGGLVNGGQAAAAAARVVVTSSG